MEKLDSVWRLRFTEVLFVGAELVTVYQLVHRNFSSAFIFCIIFSFLLAITGYRWQAIFFWPIMALIFLTFWINGSWHTQETKKTTFEVENS